MDWNTYSMGRVYMIKHSIDIDSYWKVIVYFNVNYNLFHYVLEDLRRTNISKRKLRRLYYNMSNGLAKGVTVSNIEKHISVVLFNPHRERYDYINSIAHEAEHIKQDMLRAYNVEDSGEPPAYTIGYLVMKMLMLFNNI